MKQGPIKITSSYEWHINHKKNVCIKKTCFSFFEDSQIITASRIITLTYEMTMNEKFIMIDLKLILIPHATELHTKKPEKVDALILDKT